MRGIKILKRFFPLDSVLFNAYLYTIYIVSHKQVTHVGKHYPKTVTTCSIMLGLSLKQQNFFFL